MDHSSAPASPFDYLNQPDICWDCRIWKTLLLSDCGKEVSLEWNNLIDLRAE
jgi:hypothetical protein